MVQGSIPAGVTPVYPDTIKLHKSKEKTGTSFARMHVWYNGYYVCLPSRKRGFDSRYVLYPKQALGEKKEI